MQVVLSKTPQDILRVPTIARKIKSGRNKKLSYGVMSDIEIVTTIENLNESDKAEQKRSEVEKIAEIDLTRNIEVLQNSIKESQKKLKALKV